MQEEWPSLPLASWKETYFTFHRWTQVVGKVMLDLTPLQNHFWNAALRVSARGLATGAMPHRGGLLELEFDLVDGKLELRTSGGERKSLPLGSILPVADFHDGCLSLLRSVGAAPRIDPRPCEIAEEALPLDADRIHRRFDLEAARTWWRILISSAPVLDRFRSRFVGKCSPVLFWWGSFDLACTRFSGRRAPPPPKADAIHREAYSHEQISAGIWPGTEELGGPAFYAYAVPAPPGLSQQRVEPDAAFWHAGLGEWILPWEAVRAARDPAAELLAFLESTYRSAAILARWDRAALERAPAEGEAERAARQ